LLLFLCPKNGIKLLTTTYEVDAYIYNGYSTPVSNIVITGMSLYDNNKNEIATAAFDLNPDLVIPGQSYVVWTFRFGSEFTN